MLLTCGRNPEAQTGLKPHNPLTVEHHHANRLTFFFLLEINCSMTKILWTSHNLAAIASYDEHHETFTCVLHAHVNELPRLNWFVCWFAPWDCAKWIFYQNPHELAIPSMQIREMPPRPLHRALRINHTLSWGNYIHLNGNFFCIRTH